MGLFIFAVNNIVYPSPFTPIGLEIRTSQMNIITIIIKVMFDIVDLGIQLEKYLIKTKPNQVISTKNIVHLESVYRFFRRQKQFV